MRGRGRGRGGKTYRAGRSNDIRPTPSKNDQQQNQEEQKEEEEIAASIVEQPKPSWASILRGPPKPDVVESVEKAEAKTGENKTEEDNEKYIEKDDGEPKETGKEDSRILDSNAVRVTEDETSPIKENEPERKGENDGGGGKDDDVSLEQNPLV
ncbi:hypothetical protein PHYBLDRAFT_157972, partial [Phycomyces blakesleeanus NRRL 1555(-)]